MTPRTPSGPRLAPQAAGPATRPGASGVTFPRCDTLPDIAPTHSFAVRMSGPAAQGPKWRHRQRLCLKVVQG